MDGSTVDSMEKSLALKMVMPMVWMLAVYLDESVVDCWDNTMVVCLVEHWDGSWAASMAEKKVGTTDALTAMTWVVVMVGCWGHWLLD